ncbi:hypothetical protein K1T71_011191 [Dendrolimus kikuchii]|uniref:Uncharacterized protein n=1 Tax=Dendrolimus kikuchii TaxID=765133 RepID=A0ACC1CN28_9NEOP|nr:hypothetical protein K1T71_011191 [Dendrolimus kikuchii]
MTFYKLRSTPTLLIEDDINKNIKPLLIELAHHEKNNINFFCYEQPVYFWNNIFNYSPNIKYYKDFNSDDFEKYTNAKCVVIIDSINQMALYLGWNQCLKCLQCLKNNTNVERLIVVMHKDCLSHYSKLQVHLRHIVNAIISYDADDNCKVRVVIKKNNKIFRSEERLSYDLKTSALKLLPIEKVVAKDENPEKPLPGNLTTFKIEVDQTDKMEKYKLKLPYMSKINEGESKVYYEPDAVDDWDEEDPDEDLDI